MCHSDGASMATSRSFNHFVGSDKQAGRRIQSEGFCGLDVEHGLVPDRNLHRKIGRLGAAKNLIHVQCGLPVMVGSNNPIRHQAASPNDVLETVNRWYAKSSRERNNV